MSEGTAAPYRTGFATGLGVVLLAGLVLAIADVVHTGGAVLPLLGFWALLALPLALAVGLVLGAGNAQWGGGWIRALLRRLRDDAAFDRAVAAALLAAVLIAGILAFAIGVLAMAFVAKVMRQIVGARLLGVVVVALIPILGVLALPVYRVARQVLRFVPSLGPLSRTLALVLAGTLATLAVTAFIIITKLDHQSMNIPPFIAIALLPVLAIVIGALAYGPAARLRERLPATHVLPLVGLALALAVIAVGLRGPSVATRQAVVDQSYAGSVLVPQLRKLVDRDRDGHSGFFGGPDCDDGDRAVHPGVTEVPGNGIDDNCVGGDGKATPAAGTVATPTPDAGDAGDAGAPAVPAVTGGKNLLVIFVDTLRADRLGTAGYQRDGKSMTPRLDAFAREAVVFSNAYAQAPNTPRSVPSFLGSRYPSQLIVDRVTRDYSRVDDANELLFEVLKPAGFHTVGLTSHFYFCDRNRDPSMCAGVVPWMDSNVLQGADEWDNAGAVNIPESNKDIAGPRTVAKTVAKLEALAQADRKFAMLVHLFEPHSSYMTHEGYPITTRGEASLVQKYDYEIAVVDQRIGEILDTLDKTGLAKTTTVVVLSDHGEAFGVHRFAGQRMFFHGQTLYRELLHVPLLMRVPGVAPRTADDVVELIDVAPTIAQLFGITPPKTWLGRSLVPTLVGTAQPPKPAFSELLPADRWNYAAKSMVTADGKKHVFYRITDSAWEIFDLVEDPEERKNIAATDAEAEQLKAAMAAWIEGPLAAGAP